MTPWRHFLKMETRKNSFICSEQVDYPGLVRTSYFCEGEKSHFAPALTLSLIWCTSCMAHLIVSVQMSSGLPKQLLPGNWITNEENSCYPNRSLPGNFCHRSIIFTACAHMLILICIAQTIHMIIFYSNPQGKCGGQFFPSNSVCSPFWKDLLQLISSFADFSGNF